MTGNAGPDTDFYYYRARYYDPKIGRFIAPDPLRFLGGDVNFYAYVFNNPVIATDPSGLQSADLKNEWQTSGTTSTYCPDCLTKTVTEMENMSKTGCVVICNVKGFADDILVPAAASLSQRAKAWLSKPSNLKKVGGAAAVFQCGVMVDCLIKCDVMDIPGPTTSQPPPNPPCWTDPNTGKTYCWPGGGAP